MQVELAGTVKSSSQGWAKCQQLLRDGWAPCSVNHFFMLIVLPTPSLPPTSRWRKAAAEVRLQQLGITWQPQVCFNTYMAVRCCNGTEKAQMARQLCLLFFVCLFFNDFFTFPNWKSEKLPYCTCCLTFEMRWVAIGILLHLPDACAQRSWKTNAIHVLAFQQHRFPHQSSHEKWGLQNSGSLPFGQVNFSKFPQCLAKL